ncbi:MAG: hypothetical protein M1826_007079 [Phylliscum demangeonii]|nr:MAG: hypothetical protein M1826_007079 [Phylliscum demangeonii]
MSAKIGEMPCLVTGYEDYVERAHLVPRSEWKWFASNGLRKYNYKSHVKEEAATNDVRNVIPLCVHVHKCFDEKKFAIVPKEGQWAAHFLSGTATLGRLHHNTALELDPIISSASVLARLAWAVLPLLEETFLRIDAAERVVTLLNSTTQTWTTERLKGKELSNRLLDEPRTRSNKGKRGGENKRSREESNREEFSLADSSRGESSGEEERQLDHRTPEWISRQRLFNASPPMGSAETFKPGLDVTQIVDVGYLSEGFGDDAFTTKEDRVLSQMASVGRR